MIVFSARVAMMDQSSRRPVQVDGDGAAKRRRLRRPALMVPTGAADGGSSPWPRCSTTAPHGARRLPGRGGRGARRSTRRSSGRKPLPPQTAGAQYFCVSDVQEAPAGGSPAPLSEVWPQVGEERHCGCGFELVLDVTVPQLGRELVEAPTIPFIEQTVGIPGVPRSLVEVFKACAPRQGPTLHVPASVVESPVPAVFHATAPV